MYMYMYIIHVHVHVCEYMYIHCTCIEYEFTVQCIYVHVYDCMCLQYCDGRALCVAAEPVEVSELSGGRGSDYQTDGYGPGSAQLCTVMGPLPVPPLLP